MITKKMNAAGEVYFHDEETGTDYRRVYAGLAWPFKNKPGWLILVAEDDNVDQAIGKRRLTVRYEATDISVEMLFSKMQDVRKRFVPEGFYGDPSDKGMMRLLQWHNADLRDKRIDGVGLSRAPMSDEAGNLQAYLQLIKKQLPDQGPKTLYFGEESKLPNALLELKSEDSAGDAKEWTGIACLGYVIAALETYEPSPGAGKIQTSYPIDDPLDH